MATELPDGLGRRRPLAGRVPIGNLTREMRKKIAARGWLTMHWPEEYGGQKALAGTLGHVFNEEIGLSCAPQEEISSGFEC